MWPFSWVVRWWRQRKERMIMHEFIHENFERIKRDIDADSQHPENRERPNHVYDGRIAPASIEETRFVVDTLQRNDLGAWVFLAEVDGEYKIMRHGDHPVTLGMVMMAADSWRYRAQQPDEDGYGEDDY